MADAFDRLTGRDSESGDAFDQFPVEQESFGKSAFRTALQIPQGIAEGTPSGIGAGLWQLLGAGEALDPEEIDRIRAISEREGIPFDEEKYTESVHNALKYLPTVSNIAREIESATGTPLEPKTRLEKGLRFASTATKLAPKDYTFRGLNTSLPKPVLGTGVAAAKEIMQELGVPEPIAELASFAVLKQPSAGAGKISVGEVKKPSGLTSQRYEKLKKPTEVSGKRIQKINDKTEKEFRDITSKIIEDSPIAKTYDNLKNDITFKQEAANAFDDVAKLSESLTERFSTKDLKENLVRKVSEKKNAGITPSEFDKKHNDFIKEFIKDTPEGNFSPADLVTQYRKNNKALSQAFEPGQSFAYNSAKREVLLDYNRTIADMIEKQYPNSEFSNLFKETNKRWAEISDAESINKFLDNLFDGKIQYQKGRQFFDKQGMTVPFKRAMGKEGFTKFETLMKDLMSTQQANSLLKKAESMGFDKLAKTGLTYLVHPHLANVKIGYDVLKGGYNKIFEMLLDKPQLAVTWDRGLNAAKKGNFKVAEVEFSKIENASKDFDIREKSRQEAVKKFIEYKKKKAEALPKE